MYSSRGSDLLEGGNKLLDMDGNGKVNFQRIQLIRTQTGKDRANRILEKQSKSVLTKQKLTCHVVSSIRDRTILGSHGDAVPSTVLYIQELNKDLYITQYSCDEWVGSKWVKFRINLTNTKFIPWHFWNGHLGKRLEDSLCQNAMPNKSELFYASSCMVDCRLLEL